MQLAVAGHVFIMTGHNVLALLVGGEGGGARQAAQSAAVLPFSRYRDEKEVTA